MDRRRPVIVFAAETLNLAEVTRMLELAKVARRTFECVFLSYDGERRHHATIEAEGFRVVPLEPQLGPEEALRFWRFDRMEAFGDFFTDEHLSRRVESELALYRALRPVAVVTGFCLSVNVSARVARVPLVWVAQSTWLLEHATRFGAWPDFADHPATRVVPAGLRDRLGRWLTPAGYWLWARGVNRVGARHGLAPLRGSALFEGDHMLLAEPEGYSETPIPARLLGRCHFIGPLVARLDVPIPPEVAELPRDLPIVYFAMGSSGLEDVVRTIVRAFEGQPYRVIAPVGNLLGPGEAAPSNVVVTGWLPADRVNAMARVSVLHGGIGTLLTACLAGTPIVGIPNGNPEQEYNLGCLVRKGFALQLHKRRLTARDVLDGVARMLASDVAHERARAFQRVCLAWDGPERGARFLEETFGAGGPDEPQPSAG
jgi:UDP:flavonoid glycosyltransferase YjiC (YdhE family)